VDPNLIDVNGRSVLRRMYQQKSRGTPALAMSARVTAILKANSVSSARCQKTRLGTKYIVNRGLYTIAPLSISRQMSRTRTRDGNGQSLPQLCLKCCCCACRWSPDHLHIFLARLLGRRGLAPNSTSILEVEFYVPRGGMEYSDNTNDACEQATHNCRILRNWLQTFPVPSNIL
jgi:hypothetical protein